MNNFITNTDAKDLKKRLIELIQKSDELKFLVGFFYFSGIRELYKGLKENPEQKSKYPRASARGIKKGCYLIGGSIPQTP